MSHVSPAISIQVNQDLKSTNSANANTASKGSTLPAKTQPPVGKMATSGIATGAVVAAAACGGGVFFILRRY
jgi:hypothetical protein